MSPKSSTFIQQTRERETWLTAGRPRESEGESDPAQALAVAALARGVLEAVPVPEGAEEGSRARAVACLQDLHLERARTAAVHAPWYLRLGRMMRYVFTLGRRR